MDTYRIESELQEDGKLVLTGLPYPRGKRLEVLLMPVATAPALERFPLRGLPLKYDDPFEPAVPIEAWDANK